MVSLDAMRASNALIPSTLAPGLVAIFVGATNGIGEGTLKQFAKLAVRPRVYFTGRSQEAGDRIKAECMQLNKEGQFIFMKADTSLLKSVDLLCEEIKQKEDKINLLFLSMGSLIFGTRTDEGLHYALALSYYGRLRFTANLLPLLERAKGLRRVVNVFTGTKEGPINCDDFPGFTIAAIKGRGHASSMVTLSMEEMAKRAPSVSFSHSYPGFVKTGISRGTTGIFGAVLTIFQTVLAFRYMTSDESGERHLFLATSAMFPASASTAAIEDGASIPLSKGLVVARGTDGKTGSGVYTVDENNESGNAKVESLLAELRSQGLPEKVMKHTSEEFERITGAGL